MRGQETHAGRLDSGGGAALRPPGDRRGGTGPDEEPAPALKPRPTGGPGAPGQCPPAGGSELDSESRDGGARACCLRTWGSVSTLRSARAAAGSGADRPARN